jgi:AAA domain, putative AbiEii toxin, Type IV TA system/AAA domain
MHIRRIEIQNIRSIKHLVWELPESQEGAGWHVILGDNGSGKTSFVRAVALAVIGPQNVHSLRFKWNNWASQKHPFITVAVARHDKYDSNWILLNEEQHQTELMMSWVNIPTENQFGVSENDPVTPLVTKLENTEGHPYKLNSLYFAASFGVLRRFSGGDKDYDNFFTSNPNIARHLTALGEDVDLSEVQRWLHILRFQELEKDTNSRNILRRLKQFVNHGDFLAHNAKIQDISSKGVFIKDGEGRIVPMEEMSEGYRSVLSLTFELIRQLIQCYGVDNVFDPEDPTKIICPGVVQIDEVDAHLHPTWQQRIGFWFKKHFPNIQFIVTTHSPLICWAADSVFVLPTPGTGEMGRFLAPEELNRVKYGSVQEGYMLAAFGEIDRSEEGEKKRNRLTELNGKEWDGNITDEEKEEQDDLRVMLPLSALRMK